MKTFKVFDAEGFVWGYVTESSAEAAIKFVMDDYEKRPEAYVGRPEGLRATEDDSE